MTVYKRREIILVNLYPKKGSEMGKIRPALIMSDDMDNEELETLIVLPLSTQLIDDVTPYRVRISKRDGLEYESDVLIHQIRTISKTRVIKLISQISTKEYEQIKSALCQVV
ncbi:MAG: PemK family transcriptional regulator [Sulfurovum sp.]|nr:MAG: PemK family transcriptional regulator [Sulfurovum sp.]